LNHRDDSARQLYACNSSERDGVIFLWRLVRFELVMTKNLKLRRTCTGAFFKQALDVRADHGHAHKCLCHSNSNSCRDFRSWHKADVQTALMNVRGPEKVQAADSLPQNVLAMKTGARGGKVGHAARAAAGQGALGMRLAS
jgi:hypothetical protein